MNSIHSSLIATLLFLTVPGVANAGLRQNKEVIGNLRVELVTVPDNIAADFQRLNKQALLYHPIKRQLKKCPLIIFLHGSGGANKKIQSSKWSGNVRQLQRPENSQYETKILVPQSGRGWDPVSLNKMLDYILSTNNDIDVNRIHCVGYSMGGKGTWEWAMSSPQRFAAIIPMAFIPDLSGIKGMVDLPIWAMVGTEDSKPRSEGIPKMEKALKELGSTVVRTIIFQGANHASASGKSFAQEGFYDWLFSHSRPK